MRLLLLACSATKRTDTRLLPALTRYDGPAWRTLRAYLAADPQHGIDLDVFAISAEFGIIPAIQPIPNYDRRMDARRADEIRAQRLGVPTLEARVQQRRAAGEGDLRTLIATGAHYRRALPDHSGLGQVEYTSGGIGTQLAQLKRWLHDASPRTSIT